MPDLPAGVISKMRFQEYAPPAALVEAAVEAAVEAGAAAVVEAGAGREQNKAE